MLKIKEIFKSYHNGKKELEVLKGIDLNIRKGSFVAVVGPSGAGKSTLLNIIGGLDTPNSGKVFFEEKNLYALGEERLATIRNREIGFIFQFYHLLPEFTVLENVLMPALINRNILKTKSQLRDDAAHLLEGVGLSQRIGYFPNQLSGGEKQRVAIARGLINKPKLLLCDEPTGNLDSSTGREVISSIKGLSLENNMTVVLVTHNNELAKNADCVYCLKDGILMS
ncbi:MAG: ABC transporter ATP-binding protein [Candidatus Omnitrophica bacterium]|nr:ABC transporter ATP-binding protein [Candidatus Omnitrophota bacterium]